MEHSELVAELGMVEKMSINERIKLAQKRRKQQLANHTKWAKTDSQGGHTGEKPCIIFSADVQLMDAAARGAHDEMAALLKTGVDPNLKNHDGLTAMHQCCIDGSEEMVNLLLNHGANVNVTDQDLWTPLHAAATCGHFKVVVSLVKAGAKLTIVNGDGDMPHDITEEEVTLQYLENEMLKRGINQEALDRIRSHPHDTLLVDVSTILSSGGDVNQPLTQGETFLHVAIANGFNDIVQLLLEAKAKATIADWDSWQPIHVAAYWGNKEAMELLAALPTVNLRATTATGATPYELCEDPDLKFRIIRLLSEKQDTQELLNGKAVESDEENDSVDNWIKSIQDRHDDQDSMTSDHSLSADQEISSRSSLDGTPVSPLINIELSSDRRNSIKEAKHMAPIRRLNSERSSGRAKRTRTQNDTERSETEEVTIITEEAKNIQANNISPSLPSMETLAEFYETVPQYIPPNQPDEKSYFVQQNILPTQPDEKSYFVQQNILPKPDAKSFEQQNILPKQPNEISYFVEPLSIGNVNNNPSTGEMAASNGAAEWKEQGQQETHIHPIVNEEKRKENKEVVIRMRKKGPAPQPPRGSLLDLKRQRQSLREQQQEEEEDQQGRGEARPTSTFFQPLPDLDNRVYEAPSSPSTIRYRYKMVEDDTPIRSLIKEKKCVVM